MMNSAAPVDEEILRRTKTQTHHTSKYI